MRATASIFSAREIMCVAKLHPSSSPHTSVLPHHQKLVQIVRSRDTKRRWQRVGAAGDDLAVELSDIIGAGQADNEHDL